MLGPGYEQANEAIYGKSFPVWFLPEKTYMHISLQAHSKMLSHIQSKLQILLSVQDHVDSVEEFQTSN